MLSSLHSCISSLLLLPLALLLPLVKSDPVKSTTVSYLEKLTEMFFQSINQSIEYLYKNAWYFSIIQSIVEIIACKCMIFGTCYCFLNIVFNQRDIYTKMFLNLMHFNHKDCMKLFRGAIKIDFRKNLGFWPNQGGGVWPKPKFLLKFEKNNDFIWEFPVGRI